MGKQIQLRNVRINWPRVFKAETSPKFPGNPPQFSVSVLPNKEQVAQIQAAMDEAAQEFKGKPYNEPPSWTPKNGVTELRLSAPEGRPPQVVDEHVQPVIDPNKIYSGCYCNVVLDVFASSTYGNKISAGLIALQFAGDGERLDGYIAPDAEELFKPIDVPGGNPLD